MGGYPEEGDRAYQDGSQNLIMDAAAKLAPRKESEVDNFLNNLEKELEVLSMSANGFIQNVSEVLAPEHEDGATAADEPSPSSPLGRRLFQATHRVQMVREKLNDANGRVRV